MWKRRTLRAGWTGSLIALLVLQGALYFLGSAQGPVSEVSSHAATSQPAEDVRLESGAPTPTYVSELAPAVMLAPRAPAALPSSGIEAEAGGSPWPKLAGFALALAGLVFVYSALRLGTHESQ